MFCSFFFSSRRRHTRWNCDWSSDVCSSDLLRGIPIGRLEEFAQFHRYLACIGKLNSDGVFAGNRRENVDSLSARSSCKVALETHDLVHAHAFSRIDFVTRDGGTLCDVTRSYGDSKLGQRVDENLLDFLQFRRIGGCTRFKTVLLK